MRLAMHSVTLKVYVYVCTIIRIHVYVEYTSHIGAPCDNSVGAHACGALGTSVAPRSLRLTEVCRLVEGLELELITTLVHN